MGLVLKHVACWWLPAFCLDECTLSTEKVYVPKPSTTVGLPVVY
jgi:hypothetical protein